MKHNFNLKSFSSIILKTPVVLASGVFVVTLNGDTLNKEALDTKYTTTKVSKKLFSKQIGGLSYEEQDIFMLGKSFFRIPWVEAPSATTARDGLGPLFNSNTCVNCHPNNGIGTIYNKNGSISRDFVVRLSIPSNGSQKHQDLLKYSGFVPEPTYGGQISLNGVHGVPYEAKPVIKYENIIFTYPDKTKVTLHKPLRGVKNQLKDLQYGDMSSDVSITNRLAPSLVGLGLLEKLTDKQILANEDIEDKNGDGISGKANIVYSVANKDFRVGRYTYKASAPSVLHQSGGAANNDMSLTNPLFPNENCTPKQKECNNAPTSDTARADSKFDLPMKRLEAIAFYLTNLKIPKSTITQKSGEKIFAKIGCIKCHTPSFKVDNNYEIKPFSDMLLHDMGEGLSDGRVEFLANEREWRTAPLWSIFKKKVALGRDINYLHDGRAKSIEEAILWHDGEAKHIKEAFTNLPKKSRNQVIDYIKEL